MMTAAAATAAAATSFEADEENLSALSDDVGALWCRPIATLPHPPDSFSFLRDYVHPNIPCIIRNAILHTPAKQQTSHPSNEARRTTPLHLTLDDIIDIIGRDEQITVDVTPDGHGDCVRSVVLHPVLAEERSNRVPREDIRRMFVKPLERIMSIGDFRQCLRRRRVGPPDDGEASAPREMDGDEYGLEVIFPIVFDEKRDEVAGCDTAVGRDGIRDGSFDLGDSVVYYSRQNDCLRTEMKQLFSHRLFPKTFPFAQEAFGTGPPDAINLWIGNENSVSSMHKDHYENLFYVCSGQKEFVLCPPSDVLFLHEGTFSSGTFRRIHAIAEDGRTKDGSTYRWGVVADDNDDDDDDDDGEGSESGTKWIEPDIKTMCLEGQRNENSKFPLLSKAHPVKVLVSEGEMIYIPSLWYHRVTQTCETVGVNYWFDMKFDSPHWCYFNFLQNLKKVSDRDGG